MATQFKMPQLGETVAEGTITRWLKKEGDEVQADEPLVEVSTDKVDSEIPAPIAGVVSKILAQEGETVQVGAVIAEIGGDGAGATEVREQEPSKDEAKPEAGEEQPEAQPVAETPDETGSPKTDVKEPGDRQPRETGEAPQPRQVAAVEPVQGEPRRAILSPLVRKLAADHQVDLESIRGTGTGGRITKQDVLAAVESGGPRIAASTAQAETASRAQPGPEISGGEEVVPVSVMRKTIAEHMVASLHETARAWNTVEVDMTRIGQLRQKAGSSFKQREGFSLTWMPFISKAVCQTLLKFPQVNATWNGDGTITKKHFVNLGIAVALENGLIVPVVKGADGMNIVGLARGIRDIADRARTKKLNPDEVHGGTFTITNPGPFGSILSVPIINKGQAAILATDAVVKRPVVVTDDYGNDSIAIRQMVFISMSWDHRVIDGAEAAQFLAHLKQLLEEADFESDVSGYIKG